MPTTVSLSAHVEVNDELVSEKNEATESNVHMRVVDAADITRPVNNISVGQHVLLLIEVDDLPPLHKLLIKKCVAAGGGVQIILIEDFKPNPLLSSLVQYQPSNLLTSKTTYVELRTFQIPNTPTVNFDCDISIVPE